MALKTFCETCQSFEPIRLLQDWPFGQCLTCFSPVGEQQLAIMLGKPIPKEEDMTPLEIIRPSKRQDKTLF